MQLRYFLCLGVVCGAIQAQAMKHPGVLVSREQLNFVKREVKAKKQPIYGEYLKAVASPLAALDYKLLGPPATGIIDCGSYSRPDHGCHAEDNDASAAYLQAVLWWITGDRRYADNSIRIMNTYAQQLKGYTGSNTPLQAAWSSETFPRAAEIIRYSHAGWKKKDIQAFTALLTGVILPHIQNGDPHANGNWELSMIEGMMGIAVFTNDRPLLNRAEDMWKKRVSTYFYNAKLDGDHPRPQYPGVRQSWYGQTTFDASTSGIAAETCRDLGHTGYSIAATMDAAETAHIQGDKLYESEEQRLMQVMEFHAHLLLHKEPAPKDVCGGNVHYARDNMFGIGYNEYHNRLGQSLPQTREWLDHVLTVPDPVDPHMVVFELLTHGEDANGKGTDLQPAQ